MNKIFFATLLLLVLFSCSPDEETEAPTNTVQTTTPEPETVAVQYTLTVSAGSGGSVTGGGTFDEGKEVTVTATPNEGYRFTGWEGNSSTNQNLTITINSNQTYEALFELITYTLIVTAGEVGTVSSEGGTYDFGTEVTITADEVEGYTFMGWSNDDSQDSTSITFNSSTERIPYVEIQNPTIITLNSDISITANYESETAQSGRVEILNLSSLYKTSDIKYWIDYGNTKVTNPTADILSISYDIGDFVSEWDFGRPFNKFELLLKPSQIETIMTKIGLFLENSNLINQSNYQEIRNVEMANIRNYLEGGADSSTQIAFGPQTRILLMAFSTSDGDGPPVIKIPGTRRFVLHELYHSFQKNLLEQCVNEHPYSWLTEGGARYFEAANSGEISNTDGFQWLLKENYNNLAYREGTFQSSTDAAVVLRLMVERGWLDDSTILDASFFDGCMEDYNDSNENFVQAMSLYTQVLKNSSDNYYFSSEALSSTSNGASFSLDVTASNSSNYTLSGTDRNGNISGSDPDLTFSVGDTISFVVNAAGHPFYLKTTAGTGTGNTISGITNNGTTNQTISWTPTSAGTYYYQCSLHGGMVGTITIQ